MRPPKSKRRRAYIEEVDLLIVELGLDVPDEKKGRLYL